MGDEEAGHLIQNPSSWVGQVSPDGNYLWDGTQWVLIPPGTRLATSWTRPMRLVAAGLLAVEAVFTVVSSAIFIDHDAMTRIIERQGTQIPEGMTEDQLVGILIAVFLAIAVLLALVELLGTVGAYLGWRWAFWYVLVLMALGGLEALLNVGNLIRSSTWPLATSLFQELLAIGAACMFVWMLVGFIMYGPWAMKRPR